MLKMSKMATPPIMDPHTANILIGAADVRSLQHPVIHRVMYPFTHRITAFSLRETLRFWKMEN